MQIHIEMSIHHSLHLYITTGSFTSQWAPLSFNGYLNACSRTYGISLSTSSLFQIQISIKLFCDAELLLGLMVCGANFES